MKKLLVILLSLFIFSLNADAKSLKSSFNKTIRDSKISSNSIAISVKNADTGKPVYELNNKILMHPASVQKILTIVPIMEVLGEDYNFQTELYSRGKDAYLLKLGADPYLTTSDLETLIGNVNPSTVKQIYIDDSIIESKDWGEGWQWDDDLNPYITRFNSYNLDNNTVKITIMPTELNQQAFIINPQKSPMTFYNTVITGNKNEINISRDNINSANTLKLEGTIQTPVTKIIPNNNLKRYFYKKLTDTMEDRRIYLKSAYAASNKNQSDTEIASVTHPISEAIDDILLNSNNMVIESLSKIAGGKYYNKQGSDIDNIRLFNDFCIKNHIDNSRIRLVDASGVSKNNLVDTDFISEFLLKNKDKKVYQKMAKPSQGTLSDRLIPLKDNLRAKTGTLSDISSIAGFLTAKSGQKYVFCIIINDPSSSNSAKKGLENYLLRDMYLKL